MNYAFTFRVGCRRYGVVVATDSRALALSALREFRGCVERTLCLEEFNTPDPVGVYPL